MNYPTGVDASEEVSPNQREWDSGFPIPCDGETSNFQIRRKFAAKLIGQQAKIVKLGSYKPGKQPVRILPIPEYGITLVVEIPDENPDTTSQSE